MRRPPLLRQRCYRLRAITAAHQVGVAAAVRQRSGSGAAAVAKRRHGRAGGLSILGGRWCCRGQGEAVVARGL